MSEMKFSDHGLGILKKLEAFSPKLYDDGGAKGVGNCTVGYGHLVHYGPCDAKHHKSEHEFINGITQKKAGPLLRSDSNWAVQAVNKLVTVDLTQNQFDALVIFTFNVGTAAFAHSSLLKYINKQEFSKVPSAFRMWNKSGGKVIPGLTNRREKEITLFQTK